MVSKANNITFISNEINENEILGMILQSGVLVQACRVVVYQELEFGRLRVRKGHASWLAQMGRGVLICHNACRQLTFMREAIDIPCGRNDP